MRDVAEADTDSAIPMQVKFSQNDVGLVQSCRLACPVKGTAF